MRCVARSSVRSACLVLFWQFLQNAEVGEEMDRIFPKGSANMYRWLAAFTFVMLGILPSGLAASAKGIPPPPGSDGQTTILGISDFSPPAWMAVLSDPQGIRFLVGAGDPIFHSRNPRPIGIVQSVLPDGLTMTRAEGSGVCVAPGHRLPDAGELIFRGVTLVKTQEFRHRVVGRGSRRILDGELYLVEVRGTRAILQRDVELPSTMAQPTSAPQPASPTALMEQRLAAIRIVQAGPRKWEVNAKDIRTAMESGEAIVNYALAESRIDISRDRGVGLELKTPLADVRVDSQGFQITSPNLASRVGLQVGDRILQVNDTPIDGLGALVRAYHKIRSDFSIQTVNLRLERDAQRLSFTYRIR